MAEEPAGLEAAFPGVSRQDTFLVRVFLPKIVSLPLLIIASAYLLRILTIPIASTT